MAKFHGKIGYAETEEKMIETEETESGSGVYVESITECACSGDILRNSQRWEANQAGVNDDIVINNQFSIIGNDFAYQNLQRMRYLEWMGVRWKITSFEIRSPRIILTVSGVYNA